MTISENHITMYRTPDYITMLIQDVTNSFLSFISSKVDSKKSAIVEKLRTLELQITPQIMHTFEAPLDKHDFKDLVFQLITGIMDDIIERGYLTGVLTQNEAEQIKQALDKSMELEFCTFYKPITKTSP